MLSILDEWNEEIGQIQFHTAHAETLHRYDVYQGILVVENNEIGKYTSRLHFRHPSLVTTCTQDSSAPLFGFQ